MSGDRKTVSLIIERQLKKEWCWAAVSASVDKFYRGVAQTQCQVASKVLAHRCCEEGSSSTECDHPHALNPVLESFGLLKPGDPVGQLTFDEVQKEIDAGHPICVLIKWLDNDGQIGPAGHFVAINGYRRTAKDMQFVSISDPLFSDSEYEFSHFASSKGGYHDGHGVWALSFRLRKEPAH